MVAIELMGEDFAKSKAREAALGGGRLELVRAILADSAGVAQLRRNADDVTLSPSSHDELSIALAPEKIDTVTVDGICAARGIEFVDVLKDDTRGGELKALKGAEAMLTRAPSGSWC